MKKITSSLLLISFCCCGFAQTNVSGGIFSNTTWTLAGSPYIVIDTTVVFPGVTLTIEPGVVVKFDDDKYLEIRQGMLIANGTITDSITFTSNNSSPTPGIWGHNTYGGLWFNGISSAASFNFINISYATYGMRNFPNSPYLKNSTFTYNQTGVYSINVPMDSCVFKFNDTGVSNISNTTVNFCNISNNNYAVYDLSNTVLNNCTFDSNQLAFGGASGAGTSYSEFYYCSISNNQTGLNAHGLGGNLLSHCIINNNTIQGLGLGMDMNGVNSIMDCEIKNNGIGINVFSSSTAVITRNDIEYNGTGLKTGSAAANIYCNTVCNNTSYGLQMTISANFNADDNYWCTNDSAQIAAAIYDGYDNVNFGLVTFLPTDSTCNFSTAINEITTAENGFSIFPNPTTTTIQLTLNTKTKAPLHCEIWNVMGERVYKSPIVNPKSKINMDVSFLSKGIYVVRVNELSRKLVIE